MRSRVLSLLRLENDFDRMAGFDKHVRQIAAEVFGRVDDRTYHPYQGAADGCGDHRVQAYNYRLCLTDDPVKRVPIPRPEGYDPREFALVIFGGAGPLHGAAIIREVGIRTMIVPIRRITKPPNMLRCMSPA